MVWHKYCDDDYETKMRLVIRLFKSLIPQKKICALILKKNFDLNLLEFLMRMKAEELSEMENDKGKLIEAMAALQKIVEQNSMKKRMPEDFDPVAIKKLKKSPQKSNNNPNNTNSIDPVLRQNGNR